MRIGHLIKGLGRGGAEGLLPQLARCRPAGVDWSVAYMLPWKNAMVADLEAAGVDVRCLRASSAASVLASAGRVRRWLRQQRVELFHCHLPLTGVVGRVAARREGIPVVYTEHNVLERYHWLTRRLEIATWSMQDHVVAVSDEVAASIERHLGGRTPVSVVLNGIEVSSAPASSDRAASRRRIGVPEGGSVVGTVAVFRSQKRLDLWIDVAGEIARQTPGTHFVIVGDGPLRADVERRLRESDLGDRLLLPGLQEDVAPWLAAFDVFLVTSDFEGLPLAVLEAMAAEVPVVATAVGGIPEAVEDGATGCLLPARDVAGLASAVSRLLADPLERRRLGAAARQRVIDRFSIQRMGDELQSLYGRVLEARPR